MALDFDNDFIEENLNSNIYDNIGITLLRGDAPITPISEICFPANTPIVTDQGVIPIEKINANVHTIRGNKIIAITKTVSKENYLVCFEKHSIKFNYPNRRTCMSKQHKIYYNGKLTEAHKFIGHFDNVTKMHYNGEVLYNVLMEKYDVITVNNLICETLHPDNIVAKIFASKFSQEYKNKIILINNFNVEQQRRSNKNNRFKLF
jgi:hypothetical protein